MRKAYVIIGSGQADSLLLTNNRSVLPNFHHLFYLQIY